MLFLFLCVATVLQSSSGHKDFRFKEENCSEKLHIPIMLQGPQENVFSDEQDSSPPSLPRYSQSGGVDEQSKCPPWYRYDSCNHTCHFDHPVNGIVSYLNNTLQTALLQCYCMTEDSRTRGLAIGACLYSCLITSGYYTLPCKADAVQNFTCSRLKRTGLMCGDCAPGYAPPVYSYTTECVHCSNHHAVNWIRYIAMAFLPLTAFTVIVILFKVRVTSPYLFSFVFIVQMVTTKMHMRLFTRDFELGHIGSMMITKLAVSLISFWNLDFFRLLYAPFCLHPRMTTLQAMFMDYAIALYPLLLILIVALLVERGIGRTRLGTWMWSPFANLYTHFGVEFNLRDNLVNAFATFFLLSNEKILSTSYDVLIPTMVYPENETFSSRLHLFSAGSVEYFDWGHLPYAMCSIFLLVLLVLVPLIVLGLYPLASFRRCLRRLHLDSNALHSFVFLYQESYKDGRGGRGDYRWFPVSYFILRILLLLLFSVTISSFYYPMAGVLLTAFMVFLAVCRPRKSELHNAIDVFHVTWFLVFILGIMANITAFSQTKRNIFIHTANTIIVVSSVLPFGYILGLTVYFALIRSGCVRRIQRRIRAHGPMPFQKGDGYERIIDFDSYDSLPDRVVNEREYEPLIYIPRPNTYLQ